MPRNILLTGGCGFIGHHLVEFILQNTEDEIYILDKLSYASKGFQRLRELNVLHHPRIHMFTYDLVTPFDEGFIEELQHIHWIIHLAAETHVDNSIIKPDYCIHNNIMSTIQLLELARKLKHLEKFLYFSTDEVYGPALNNTLFTEKDRHHPTNPYSASKSASEAICLSYENTYKIPLIICNTMNVFGERQHIEKFIPICIRNILHHMPVSIHSYPGCEKAGSRFYIYVKNVASAVYFLMQHGVLGETYHIPGQQEINNDTIVDIISSQLQIPAEKKYIDFHSKRPGHDLRYGLDGSKIMELGWIPEGDVNDQIRKVVTWTLNNPQWLK